MALLNTGGKTHVVAVPSPGQNVDVRTLTFKSIPRGCVYKTDQTESTHQISTALSTNLVLCEILFEALHHVAGQTHVIKHAFQLLRERVSPTELKAGELIKRVKVSR